MNPACTLTSILQRVSKEASQNWDEVIDPSELRMSGGELHLRHFDQPPRPLKANTWAEGQLCSKLGIPVGYFRKCPPMLKDAQFEYWMNQLYSSSNGHTPRLLLRGSGQTLRGVLSERYACIDNLSLIEAIDTLESTGLEVKGFEMTEVSFHLRLVDPTSYTEAGSDDPLFSGVHISNSEVGMRTLSVDALVYRQVCTNGLVRLVRNRSVYARKHIGHAPEQLASILRESAMAALDLGCRSALAFAQAKEMRIDDPEAKLTALAKPWNLTEEVQESIVRQLSIEPLPDTAYGLINAITTVARSQDPDERFRIETLAGSLLN